MYKVCNPTTLSRFKHWLLAPAAFGLIALGTPTPVTAGNTIESVLTNDSIYNNNDVEQPAQYKDGTSAMLKLLANNIKYPKDAMSQNIQGASVVWFVVDKQGKIADVGIQRSLHPSCDKEAIRIIKKLKRWTPAQQNGQPVNVKFYLPVKFSLQ